MSKIRLDVLVQTRAAVSRTVAQGLIRTGKVVNADGDRLLKPALQIDEDAVIAIESGPKFASRGGTKLEAAIQEFEIDLSGRIAMDVGASTGGFTDCLLQHGAAKVYAIDVGYGQLAWELRNDPRVEVLERTNIRHLAPGALEESPDFFTIDCSFISLSLVLPAVKKLVREDAEGIVLIKPQFEAGREQVGKGGVVRDESVHRAVVENVTEYARALGMFVAGVLLSPLEGPAGNKEFLAHLRPGGGESE